MSDDRQEVTAPLPAGDPAWLVALVEGSNDAIIGVDLHGYVLSWNSGAERMYGFTASEMLGHHVLETIVPPEHAHETTAFLAHVAEGERIESFETERRRKDGSRLPVAVTVSPVCDAAGRVVGASTIGRDISKRRAAEQALEQSEHWARSVIESSPEAVIGIDEQSRVTAWNRVAELTFGWTTGETLGQPVTRIIPERDREAHNRGVANYLLRGTGPWVGGRSCLRALHRDGHEVPIEMTILAHEGSGHPRFTAFISDQSYQYKAEEEIRRLASIVEYAEDAILAKDLEGTIFAWNRAAERLYGYTAREMIGHNVRLLEAPDRVGETRVLLDRLAAGERIAQYETRRRRKDGHIMDVALTFSPLRDSRGNITGSSVIVRDISAEKRAEQALLQAQKFESLGVLAGGVAHDFNNLLMGILGNTELLLASLPEDSPLRESVADVELTARRAAELARQLLAYSGRGMLSVERTDLNALVSEMGQLLGLSIRRGVNLRFRLEDGLPPIQADATQVRQVAMNLIVNASDAIESGSGTITVTTGAMHANREYLDEVYLANQLAEGHYVFLEVSDTGKGMDEATRARIFDPFFTTKPSGRGLGLAAALGVIRGHRGAIRVYSEVGHGTTFKILLPAAGQGGRRSAPQMAQSDALSGRTVLVIDDEEHVRNVTTRALAAWGIESISAENGAHGIEILGTDAAESVALVLLDLTMPGLGGVETYAAISEIRPGLPIVIMSGYNQHDVADRFAGQEFAGFVQKPYQIAELREAVLRALEGR